MTWARAYVRKLYNKFAATLVASERLADVLVSWGVRNVHPARLGVNTDIFQPTPNDGSNTRRALGIALDQKLLLYIGRLAKEKNTETLFQSFERLQNLAPGRFHLLVIGDGPQRNHLERLRANVGNVSWIQYCTDSTELARYYRAADLFVHPGIQETFGFVALESQACGTPVVGIRGSYMDRIIFHQQDSWSRANTPDALADAIEQSSTRKLSILGNDAAEVAGSSYSWPRVFEQLFCIYREVCANYRRS